MTKRLYVGNLPYSVDNDGLKSHFSPFGEVVSAVVIMDKFSGRSKGFGFVEMPAEDAEKAIADLDGKELEGRALVVNEARPMQERR